MSETVSLNMTKEQLQSEASDFLLELRGDRRPREMTKDEQESYYRDFGLIADFIETLFEGRK